MQDIVQVIVIGVVIAFVALFVIGPYQVSGDSMAPAFHSGQFLIVEKISHRIHSLKPGDVIIFNYKDTELLKRIVRITDTGEYWVEGDNKEHSSDSRVFGAIPESVITSKVMLALW